MDIQYLLFLQSCREATGGILDTFMLRATILGEQIITWLVLAFIYWCVDKHAGQMMALNVSVACTWNQFIKWKCRIDRPWIRDDRIIPVQQALAGAGGYSFPSGHTQRAAAVWGALGHSLWEKKERAVSLVCWVILAVIAFSRNYLGVHTPQDVLAALALGIVIIFASGRALRWVDEGANRDIIAAGVLCLLCFLPMLKAGCLSNAGAGMGLLIGWVIERRFIDFETKDGWSERCVRFAVGGAGVLFILTVLLPVLNTVMESKYAGFFTSFSLAVFIMAVYPFFFVKRERFRKGIILLAILLAGILGFSVCRVQIQKAQEKAVEAESESQHAGGEQKADKPEAAKAGGPNAEAATEKGTGAVADTATEDNKAAAEGRIPAVIAHRGYSSVFPENTMAAFEGAVDIGVDYIELDVQLSKDGEIVVFHDDGLKRITGMEGRVSDHTYDELCQMDAGSWFSPSFAGEKIPALQEVLEFVEDSECRIYLELKDIGGADEGFEEAVLDVVKKSGMLERCVFASFRYEYLSHLKELDSDVAVLYNTVSGKVTLPEEFPADYYGISLEAVTEDTINAIHRAGKQAFVWTADTPAQMQNVQDMGADGIVTNCPGLLKVIRQPEYIYLAENYEDSVTMPGLYGPDVPRWCEDMIVQGFTKAGSFLVVSAYSRSGERNSILYIMNLTGKLQKIVDLGFKAHTGGIAYDELHDLLWVTGPEGKVYAASWTEILNETYKGEIRVSFDAGLVNHNETKVASYLTLFEGDLYVGSYVNGSTGLLNRYDLKDVGNPELLSTATIPERIQGVTFKRNALSGECYMLLSQGYQTEDSHLLKYAFDEQTDIYDTPAETYVLPEGVEQILVTAKGMYILFESAVRPYRATARIPNDQIYLIRE